MLRLIGLMECGGKYWIDDKPRHKPKQSIQPKYAKGKRAHGKEKSGRQEDYTISNMPKDVSKGKLHRASYQGRKHNAKD